MDLSLNNTCCCWQFADFPKGSQATVRTVAERLALKHNSTVELIDRLEKKGFLRRIHSRKDRRCVLVALLPRGNNFLEKVARQRITELRAGGAALVNAIDALVGRGRKSSGKKSSRESIQKIGGKTFVNKNNNTKMPDAAAHAKKPHDDDELGDFTTTRRVIPISLLAR